jgi:hypothetical protein
MDGPNNLSPLEDITDCGVKCVLSDWNKCDFFLYEFPKCYLASYNVTDGFDIVLESTGIASYHNLEIFDQILWNNTYQSFVSSQYDVSDWNRWIFKTTPSYSSFRKCVLLCFLDVDCDYFVFTDEFCYFGSFIYSGDAISTENPTEILTVRLKMTGNATDNSTVSYRLIRMRLLFNKQTV